MDFVLTVTSTSVVNKMPAVNVTARVTVGRVGPPRLDSAAPVISSTLFSLSVTVYQLPKKTQLRPNTTPQTIDNVDS